ncbi:MAG TPA: TA system VapC family ribonuclease toxin [Vicinamibacteria bacterium]|nr:TA system VapC family ribonuclease toxin [Vicinamibacteria bacterium]
MTKPEGAALLDVNALVALFDPDHVHHEAAHEWLARNRADGWATCPLTENGLVRILSNAAYSGVQETASSVRRRLAAFCASGQHVFWADEVSLRDRRLFPEPAAFRHAQVTDVYLLGLATYRGGRLATFDRRIPVRSVAGARLEVIPA